MKKLFFIAALAGAALVSCTKNEGVETPEQDVITFAEPVTALSTKAVEIGENYPTSQNFSVFAHYYTEAEGGYTTFAEGDLYMDDVETSYNSDIKGWDPKTGSGVNYYWPKQGTLTFAAYSPSKVDATYDKEGIHFANYTVDTDCTKQYDLLYSERSYDQTKEMMVTNAPYNGVQIKFNHALSSILFTVRTDADYAADNFNIVLKKISIKNVLSQATFNQGLEDGNGEVTKPVADHFGWAGHSYKKEYVAYNSSKVLSTVASFTENISVTDPRQNDTQNTNLILLPQEFSDQQLYIEYQIVNKNVGSDETVVNQNATFNLNYYGDGWKRGYRYVYNLTFGFDKIYFDPVVTEWDEVVVTPDVEIGR